MEVYKISDSRIVIRPYDDAGKSYSETYFIVISELMDNDFYPFGDEYCCGNAIGMAMNLFSFSNGMVYTLFSYDIEKLSNGNEICLDGHSPDEEEVKAIQKEFN